MGRQIALIAPAEGEARLEAFLRTCGEVRLFRCFASCASKLEFSTLASAPDTPQVTIWLADFPWTPKFALTAPEVQARSPERSAYVRNDHTAPVLKYARANTIHGSAGRLFQADRFSGEPRYGRLEFSKRVDRIWRWIRKHAVRMPDSTWFLSALSGAPHRLLAARDGHQSPGGNAPAATQLCNPIHAVSVPRPTSNRS